METKDIYIKSLGEKIALTIFWDKEKIDRKKDVVIFLPGTMANPYTYWDYIEKAVEYGNIYVGVHYIGHGLSSREKEVYTVEDLIQNSIDVIDFVFYNKEIIGSSKDSKISLLGHSQGGIIASKIIGRTKHVSKYLLGNVIISDQTENKNMIGLEKVPNIFIPIIKWIIKIVGKIFAKKQMKFSDYVKKPGMENVDQDFEEDERRITRYPLSMVTSLLTIDTKNITKPKEKIDEQVYLIIAKKDEIFDYEIQKKAFEYIKAENKKLIEVDADKHMMYTEYPEKLSKIISEIVNK